MPTPTSISSSAMSKVGLPAAGTVQLVSAIPIERVAALTRSPRSLQGSKVASLFGSALDDFLHDERAGDAAPSGRKVEVSTATSSSVITVAIDFPDISRAMSKFMTSPS